MNVQTVPPTQPTRTPFQEFKVVMALSKVATTVQEDVDMGTAKLKFPSCPCCHVSITVVMVLHDTAIVKCLTVN